MESEAPLVVMAEEKEEEECVLNLLQTCSSGASAEAQ